MKIDLGDEVELWYLCYLDIYMRYDDMTIKHMWPIINSIPESLCESLEPSSI